MHTGPTFVSDLLKDRAALVTGGGTGICRGFALALAAHGCHVAITSRSLDHLTPTAEEITRAGVQAIAVAADVRDAKAMETVVAETVSKATLHYLGTMRTPRRRPALMP